MRASALRRSVMSSSSTTAPPPVIGWNVHDSDRPRVMSGPGVIISRAWVFSISDRIILPLAAETEPATTQAAMMSEALAPRCTRSSDRFIISLKGGFMTASRPSARNMQRPSELPAQPRLTEARRQRLDDDGVEAEVDALEAEEEQRQQHRKADIIG